MVVTRSIKLLRQGTTVESDAGTNERRQPTGAEQLKHMNSCEFQSREAKQLS